ncbi:MAG: DegV family protein [Thermacetogeniaceae bacterium]|jgi:DegV family protein with EDD domain|nr:DegV family protein [Syntrophomonadaceae bacterium]
MIQVITDSAADLPAEIVKKYNITVVPLTVHIDGEEYTDGVDISSQEFYKKMAKSKELPKTSQPSVASFIKVFQELESKGEQLCINISSKLSGTYQTACLAQKLSGVNVAVFDSWSATLGQGLQVIKAALLAEKGMSREHIIQILTEYKKGMTHYVLLDTLENVVKGGRLSKFQGTLAKLLNIKVLLTGVEGALIILDKIHGRKKALQRIIDRMGEKLQGAKDIPTKLFSISHFNNLKDAEMLKSQIMKKFDIKDEQFIINEMGATIATYAGEGGMVISF